MVYANRYNNLSVVINICDRIANILDLFLDISSVQSLSHTDSLRPCGHLLLVCILNDILTLLCICIEKKCKDFFILMFDTELAVFIYISDNLSNHLLFYVSLLIFMLLLLLFSC